MMRTPYRVTPFALCVAAALGLTACAVGPDYHRPAPPPAEGYTASPPPVSLTAGGVTQALSPGKAVDAKWWTGFKSPALDALVDEALRANPDVAAAQAALRQAHELVWAQRALFAPNVQASFSPSRQKNPVGTLAPTLSSGAPIYNLYTSQLSISYTLDIFGANRRMVESLVAAEDMQRFQLEATYLTLATNVVATAVQEAALRDEIASTERLIVLQTEQVKIGRNEVELGSISHADLALLEAQLAQTVALLPPLRRSLALQRDALCALLGRPPSNEPDAVFHLKDLSLPGDVPVVLPGKLVERRPDVRMAEAQMHAASAQVGVAIGAMLPQVSIAASAGGTATAFGQMFSAGNKFWSAGATLSQTLFAGGALYRHEQAAVAALDQAGAQYRGVVITAFQNVADSLHALEFDTQSLQANIEAEDAAERAFTFAKKQHELGSISYLAMVAAEQTYQQALINRIQAQANRLADTAALIQAVGGGWAEPTGG
jgi:NodT family efflux transporter outer membrane factor (OMF) lipoprotein